MLSLQKVRVAVSLLPSLIGLLIAVLAPMPSRATTLLATSAERIRLSSAPTRVAMTLSAEATGAQSLDAQHQHVLLVMEGLSAALAPGTSYDVYLGPAAGPQPARDDPGYAGTLNFYDISSMTPSDARAVSFDVTAVLARLRKNGDISRPLAVTFVPDAPPQENSQPVVEHLRLIIP